MVKEARVQHEVLAGGSYVESLGIDQEDNLTWGASFAVKPTWHPIPFRAVLNAAIATTTFHTFNTTGVVKAITEIHVTAGNDAGAVTGAIYKDRDTVAAGAGVSLMTSTFNLKGTAETQQTATVVTATDTNTGLPTNRFKAGDSLSFKLTGTPTTAAGVFVTVWVQYDLPVFEASWYSAAATSTDQAFFIANRSYPVRAIRYRHATAETTDTTANVQVVHSTGTDAPGAGTDILTNDGSAGFDINAAANTVQVATGTMPTLQYGERLTIDFNSTQTEGAGICITAMFTAQANRIEVPFWMHDTNVTDAYIFNAARDCRLIDGRLLHAVAAGGASTATNEKLRGTTAVGSGTALLATTWNLNATANTVQVLDPVTFANSQEALFTFTANDRMSIDYADTEQSLVGVCATYSFMML